jgi:hypothetical protein
LVTPNPLKGALADARYNDEIPSKKENIATLKSPLGDLGVKK